MINISTDHVTTTATTTATATDAMIVLREDGRPGEKQGDKHVSVDATIGIVAAAMLGAAIIIMFLHKKRRSNLRASTKEVVFEDDNNSKRPNDEEGTMSATFDGGAAPIEGVGNVCETVLDGLVAPVFSAQRQATVWDEPSPGDGNAITMKETYVSTAHIEVSDLPVRCIESIVSSSELPQRKLSTMAVPKTPVVTEVARRGRVSQEYSTLSSVETDVAPMLGMAHRLANRHDARSAAPPPYAAPPPFEGSVCEDHPNYGATARETLEQQTHMSDAPYRVHEAAHSYRPGLVSRLLAKASRRRNYDVGCNNGKGPDTAANPRLVEPLSQARKKICAEQPMADHDRGVVTVHRAAQITSEVWAGGARSGVTRQEAAVFAALEATYAAGTSELVRPGSVIVHASAGTPASEGQPSADLTHDAQLSSHSAPMSANAALTPAEASGSADRACQIERRLCHHTGATEQILITDESDEYIDPLEHDLPCDDSDYIGVSALHSDAAVRDSRENLRQEADGDPWELGSSAAEVSDDYVIVTDDYVAVTDDYVVVTETNTGLNRRFQDDDSGRLLPFLAEAPGAQDSDDDEYIGIDSREPLEAPDSSWGATEDLA